GGHRRTARAGGVHAADGGTDVAARRCPDLRGGAAAHAAHPCRLGAGKCRPTASPGLVLPSARPGAGCRPAGPRRGAGCAAGRAACGQRRRGLGDALRGRGLGIGRAPDRAPPAHAPSRPGRTHPPFRRRTRGPGLAGLPRRARAGPARRRGAPPRCCRRAGDVQPFPRAARPTDRRRLRRRNTYCMSAAPELPDLDTCAREPIHIPGSIQPHGILLVIDPATGLVLQASANAAGALLGGNGAVQGQAWDTLLRADPAQLAALGPVEAPVHLAPARCTAVHTGQPGWRAGWHLCPERWLLELEPAQGAHSLVLGDALRAQREIDRAPGIAEAARHAAGEIRALTGYDRVMVYRFDEDWHGDVIAEVRRPGLESYLGLHYPATDIPAQARALYLRTRIRQIVDVGYVPVPVEPTLDPRDGQPLDLSDATLRSVSPVHCEYLGN